MSAYTLRPCPFCGHQPREDNLIDSIHPEDREQTLWTASCVDNEGGCNASVLGSSYDHVIALWNTRAGEDRTLVNTLNVIPERSWLPRSIMVLCKLCGNKRCPHVDERYKCTHSNDLNQVGELL